MTRRLTVLGSTGSIGCSTLDVVRQMGGRDAFAIEALTGGRNVALLAEQARVTGAKLAVIAEDALYRDLKDALAGSGIEAAAGAEAVRDAAARPAEVVMAAIVGAAGLEPTLAAAARGATIALANKECLVTGGGLFTAAVKAGGGRLIPVDSEHSAIFQCLSERHRPALERLILTASGGPFRQASLAEMETVTIERAAAHPNWSMGRKISVGSATMFNKALEMIEAAHLFDVPAERIEVLVHPQSIVHSMVGYADGSILAQLGPPDMRSAIGFALAWPVRVPLEVERIDFARLARLDFEAPDEVRFPALRLARLALARGGGQPAVLNGAEEAAYEAFAEGRLGFLEIARVVERVMDALAGAAAPCDIPGVLALDNEARRLARDAIARRTRVPA